MSLSRPLTAGQVTALMHFAFVGGGRAPARLNPASLTALIAMGLLTQDRETKHFSVTEAGRLRAAQLMENEA